VRTLAVCVCAKQAGMPNRIPTMRMRPVMIFITLSAPAKRRRQAEVGIPPDATSSRWCLGTANSVRPELPVNRCPASVNLPELFE
jgi:hypothetical protein